MVNRGAIVLLGLWLALCTPGCVEESLPVRLDLCPGQGATGDDLRMLERVTRWDFLVSGIESSDVEWSRIFRSSDQITTLTFDSAVPRSQEIRFLVEGFGRDEEGEHRLLAVGASELLVLRGAERVCLCVSPPARYLDLCPDSHCTFDLTSETCGPPR